MSVNSSNDWKVSRSAAAVLSTVLSKDLKVTRICLYRNDFLGMIHRGSKNGWSNIGADIDHTLLWRNMSLKKVLNLQLIQPFIKCDPEFARHNLKSLAINSCSIRKHTKKVPKPNYSVSDYRRDIPDNEIFYFLHLFNWWVRYRALNCGGTFMGCVWNWDLCFFVVFCWTVECSLRSRWTGGALSWVVFGIGISASS